MKKLISLLLALLMTLGLSVGLTALADDPITITLFTNSLNNGFPENDKANDFVYQKMLADTGIALDIVLVGGGGTDYYTALNVRLMSEAPDLFWSQSDNMKAMAAQGLIKNLQPYADNELAPLLAWIGDTDTTAYRYQGDLYQLPKSYVNSTSYILLNVRTDWLKALNLEVPKTVEDLYNVAYAFTFNDPDGDGQANTFGYSGQKGLHAFHVIANCYDTALGNYVIVRDGKVTNAVLQPGMKDALTMCKKFVDDKIMDPDILTTSGTNNAISGKTGLITLAWSSLYKASYMSQVKELNPNAEWLGFGPLESEVGAAPCMTPLDLSTSAGAYCINADISDENLAAVFKLINYIISKDGSNLVYYGIENDHWVYNADGTISMTENATAANYTPTYQLFGRNERDYLSVKFIEATPQWEHAMGVQRFEIHNSLVEEPEGYYLTDLESYITTQLTAFIYGERDIAQYDKFVQELYDVYDFQAYMDAATEQLIALGYAQ